MNTRNKTLAASVVVPLVYLIGRKRGKKKAVVVETKPKRFRRK